MLNKLFLTINYIILLTGLYNCERIPEADPSSEIAAVTQIIHNSIGWATTKDTTLLYNSFAQDSSLFFFNPDSAGTIKSFDEFKNMAESFFMNDAFKAIRYEIRDLRVTLSQNRNTAWFSCILDDENEWNGRSASWFNTRWTGVLEKRNNKWVITQMHFSFASD